MNRDSLTVAYSPGDFRELAERARQLTAKLKAEASAGLALVADIDREIAWTLGGAE